MLLMRLFHCVWKYANIKTYFNEQKRCMLVGWIFTYLKRESYIYTIQWFIRYSGLHTCYNIGDLIENGESKPIASIIWSKTMNPNL